jgi:hypothetical protein
MKNYTFNVGVSILEQGQWDAGRMPALLDVRYNAACLPEVFDLIVGAYIRVEEMDNQSM